MSGKNKITFCWDGESGSPKRIFLNEEEIQLATLFSIRCGSETDFYPLVEIEAFVPDPESENPLQPVAMANKDRTDLIARKFVVKGIVSIEADLEEVL